MRVSAAMIAIALAAGFAGGPTAFAQDGAEEVRLSGRGVLAPTLDGVRFDLPTAPLEAASTSVASDAEPAALSRALPNRDAARPQTPDVGSASALPWYQRFTVAPSESRAVWAQPAEGFRLQAGQRWGVTLGYTAEPRSRQDFDLQDFSAGAFFEFSERFRFGGQVRFTSPEEEIFGEEGEERAPEIKFESAFRF